MSAQIQGRLSSQEVVKDPEFLALPAADKIGILERVDPDFGTLTKSDQMGVVTALKPVSQPSPFADFMSGIGNEFLQQGSAGLVDRPEPVNQAGQFGSFLGALGGGFANVGAGALAGGLAGSVIPGVGNVAGAIGGGILGAATGAFGRDIRTQVDAGRPVNYGRSAIAGLGSGLGQAVLPGAGGFLGRVVRPALIQGGIGAATEAGMQAADGSPLELNDILRNAAMGAGFGAAPGVLSRQPKSLKLPQSGPRIPLRNLPLAFEQSTQMQEGRAMRAAVKKQVSDIQALQSVSEKQTYADRLAKLKAVYDRLDEVDRFGQPVTARNAQVLKGFVKAQYEQLSTEKAARFPTQAALKQANAKALKPGQLSIVVNLGVKAVKTGGVSRSQFKQAVRKYRPEDQARINRGIENVLRREKLKAKSESDRVLLRRENGKLKISKINQQRQDQRKAEIEASKAEREKQKAELKAAETDAKRLETLKKTPVILDMAETEAKANELMAHEKANEKGQLSAKLEKYRKASKTDYTKSGFSKERSEAINKSYQRLLDRYAQIKAKAKEKPSAVEMKQGKEANRKDLAELNAKGGKYNPGDTKALQVPAKGLTLEEAKNTKEWDSLDQDTKNKAELAMQAAKGDHKAIIEYDAERSGDTGQFKLKTVSPLSLDFINDRLIMHAINENGHHATYYLSPSNPNSKTGTVSYTHELTLLPEQKARLGLDSNIYKGQRELSVQEIMNRPTRKTAGLTSETETLIAEYGQDVHKVRKSVESFNRTLRKYKQKLARVSDIVEAAKVLSDSEVVKELDDRNPGLYEAGTGEPC